MAKKEYIAPEIEVIDFENEGILASSGDFYLDSADYEGEWDE